MSRRKTWAADLIRRHMPRREEMARNRWLKPFAHRFLSPELWRFTRRSVPRGVGLGLFCAFIIPLGQIILAAFMALPARANVPVAVVTTLITNPFTYPFWVVTANRLGMLALDIDANMGSAVIEGQVRGETWTTFSGFFEAAGVTVFGFLILALVSAAIGYVVSGFLWRLRIKRKRQRRLASMAQRMDARLEASRS